MSSVYALIADAAVAAPAVTAAPADNPAGQGWIMFPVIGVMFYFLLIRPQQRQRKEQEKRMAALQKGDQVVTTAGIYGLVHHIKERTVILKVAEGTLIEFDKNAVSNVIKKDSAATESK